MAPSNSLPPQGLEERLTGAINDAVGAASPESEVVCDAVQEVVAHAKADGAPPEQVLARLKRLLTETSAIGAMPQRFFSALTAWVVRCFLQAFYPSAK